MADRYDGGPAFPVDELRDGNFRVRRHSSGMSLRDHFASQAAASMVSGVLVAGYQFDGRDAERVAISAYALADAMIQERSDESTVADFEERGAESG